MTFSPKALNCISKKATAPDRTKYTKIGTDFRMCFKLIKCDRKLVHLKILSFLKFLIQVRTMLFSYGFIQVRKGFLLGLNVIVLVFAEEPECKLNLDEYVRKKFL